MQKWCLMIRSSPPSGASIRVKNSCCSRSAALSSLGHQFDISPIQDGLEDPNFLRMRAKLAPLGPCRNVALWFDLPLLQGLQFVPKIAVAAAALHYHRSGINSTYLISRKASKILISYARARNWLRWAHAEMFKLAMNTDDLTWMQQDAWPTRIIVMLDGMAKVWKLNC
jgi:hypothetical protein